MLNVVILKSEFNRNLLLSLLLSEENNAYNLTK